MTDVEIRLLTRRAKSVAVEQGFREDAEDLAQEVVLAFLKNPESKQTVKQAVIDAVRKDRGRSGGSEKRHDRTHLALEDVPELPGNDDPPPTGALPLPPDWFRILTDLRNLRPYARAMFVLYHGWGLDNHEVGVCFGITPSDARYQIRKVEWMIRKKSLRKRSAMAKAEENGS